MGFLIRAAMLMVCMAVPAYLLIASFAIFEPYLIPLRYLKDDVQAINEHVLIGPYAEADDLEAIKRSGVTTVVSLLDPSVVYEKSLIERESVNAHNAGLRFVNLPIHKSEPFTSAANRNSTQRLALLFDAKPQDKIYVHGFLSAPRDLVAQEVARAAAKNHAPAKPVSNANATQSARTPAASG